MLRRSFHFFHFCYIRLEVLWSCVFVSLFVYSFICSLIWWFSMIPIHNVHEWDMLCNCYTTHFVPFQGEASSTLDSIIRLKSRLSDFIEPDFGLLDHLLSLDVLTRRQYDDVRYDKGAPYRRTEAIMDLLATEDQCDKFLKALQRTGQQHVVNFITQNGGQNYNVV